MQRKKIFLYSPVFAILIMLLLLAGCGDNNSTEQFELYMVPQKYFNDASEKGTVETLTYHVESYAVEAKEGLPAGSLYEDKTLYVYLPHGYDAGRPYNILYLLHGSNETVDYWFYTQKTMGAYFREENKHCRI